MKKSEDKRFTLSFGKSDGEAAEWFFSREDKGAYLKALILEDMVKEAERRGERQAQAVYPAVQPAGRGN